MMRTVKDYALLAAQYLPKEFTVNENSRVVRECSRLKVTVTTNINVDN